MLSSHALQLEGTGGNATQQQQQQQRRPSGFAILERRLADSIANCGKSGAGARPPAAAAAAAAASQPHSCGGGAPKWGRWLTPHGDAAPQQQPQRAKAEASKSSEQRQKFNYHAVVCRWWELPNPSKHNYNFYSRRARWAGPQACRKYNSGADV